MNIIQLAIPLFFLLIFLELVWAFYKNKKIYTLSDAFANIGCGITEQLSGLVVNVITVGTYSWIYHNWSLINLPDSGFYLFILFLCLDFSYYWAHRMSHQINLFWIGHSIHHQSESYNLSVALRQGALQKLFTLPFFLWMAFIGFNDTWFLFIYALNTLYQFWIHTESIRTLPKWFEFVFNTPSHHRVHHGRNPQYIDKNHGGSLIIWDRIFGTFEAENEIVIYGITSRISTWNPLLAHWIPVRDLIRLLRQTPFTKWHLALFYSPSWLHRNEHSLKNGVGLKSEFKSFLPTPLLIYALVHFVIFIGTISFFLFVSLKNIGFLHMAGFVLVFLIQLGLLARLFENSGSKFFVEIFRLVLLAMLFYVILGHGYLSGILVFLSIQLFFLWVPFKYRAQSFISHQANALY